MRDTKFDEKLFRIVYLIDQQASHAIVVYKKHEPSFQPILIGEENSEHVLELSREQALELASKLKEAALQVKGYSGIEYPGKVIKVE